MPGPGGQVPAWARRIDAGTERAVPSLPFEDADRPLFTVGQVSEMLEVQQAFLRRLDDFGVVRPSRSGGGQRRYTRTEITVVQYVVQLADQGMTLAGIRRVLDLEARIRELERECQALRAVIAGREQSIAGRE
jgi:MerR family transcriptional regulator/heat shock protein HspR